METRKGRRNTKRRNSKFTKENMKIKPNRYTTKQTHGHPNTLKHAPTYTKNRCYIAGPSRDVSFAGKIFANTNAEELRREGGRGEGNGEEVKDQEDRKGRRKIE